MNKRKEEDTDQGRSKNLPITGFLIKTTLLWSSQRQSLSGIDKVNKLDLDEHDAIILITVEHSQDLSFGC